jgi:hypothetical protein
MMKVSVNVPQQKCKKTYRPRTSFASSRSACGSKVLQTCRTATSLTGTLSPTSQPNWKNRELNLLFRCSDRETTNLVFKPKFLNDTDDIIPNHQPSVASNSPMEVKKVTLQGPVIRIFRRRVDVLDAVRCKRTPSFRRPAIVDNRDQRVDACYQIQVDFVEFHNLFHDCITHAGTLRNVTCVELRTKVSDKAQE